MGRPENGIYIILGEANLVVTAMRRNSRWNSHSHQDDDQDPLITSFSQLKDILNTVAGTRPFLRDAIIPTFVGYPTFWETMEFLLRII